MSIDLPTTGMLICKIIDETKQIENLIEEIVALDRLFDGYTQTELYCIITYESDFESRPLKYILEDLELLSNVLKRIRNHIRKQVEITSEIFLGQTLVKTLIESDSLKELNQDRMNLTTDLFNKITETYQIFCKKEFEGKTLQKIDKLKRFQTAPYKAKFQVFQELKPVLDSIFQDEIPQLLKEQRKMADQIIGKANEFVVGIDSE